MKKLILILILFSFNFFSFSQTDSTNRVYSFPDNATFNLVLTHLKKAKKFYKNNKYQKAIDEFTEALNLAPYETGALLNRGEMYLKIGKKDEACKDWYKIQELNQIQADELIKYYCN